LALRFIHRSAAIYQPRPGAILGRVYAVYGRYRPSSACRPASVILSHVTCIDRPPAWMLPGDAVASPSRTNASSIVREAVRHHHCFGGTERRAGQQAQRPVLFGRETALWPHCHCARVKLSRCGCSCRFGRASAPMIPHRVHTMRGPNDSTGTS
jgi:hypothetical protein